MEWKVNPGSENQAPLVYLGDYVISCRVDTYILSHRPEGKHEHVGEYKSLVAAMVVAESRAAKDV